jgi:hypothetical protein
MKPLYGGSLVVLLTMQLALPASVQEMPREPPVSSAATRPSSSPTSLTGKERLGRKWMDEQRIDNCNVPIHKRGMRSRPGTCPHLPAG